MSGPGCPNIDEVLLRIRSGWEVRKQRKKTFQSLQMSPRMASLRQGGVLGILRYKSFHRWFETEYLLPYQQRRHIQL